jgi:hypothetical protein
MQGRSMLAPAWGPPRQKERAPVRGERRPNGQLDLGVGVQELISSTTIANAIYSLTLGRLNGLAASAFPGEAVGQEGPLRFPAINPDLALPTETALDRGVPHPPHEQRMGARAIAADTPGH